LGLQTEYINDGTLFFKIEPLSINPECLADFYVYEKMPHDDKRFRFRCLLVDFSSLSKEKLIKVLQSWDDVYIHKLQKKIYKEYLKNNLDYILSHDDIDISKKTETLIRLSTDVIKDAFETNFTITEDCRNAFENVQKLISKAFEFITDINSLAGISNLIGHDYDTHTHSIKVGWLMATFINANKELFELKSGPELKKLMIQATAAGLLHDIGKVKIPQNILNKKGKLDNLEYLIIQSHTAYSASILFNTGLSKQSMQAILFHHENEDGSGYPNGLVNDQIPLIAKICHITDVFDALTSKRHYKASKTPFEALKIMVGDNPYLDKLQKFEQEAKENKKTPVSAVVRDDYDMKLQRLREREMIEEEARKRVEARLKLRDKGMIHCFDKDLLKRFIYTINQSESFHLTGLLSENQ
jgi:HD-GYP domain-containing protein (c-di-GMP phosphodiesterase class II)